MRINVELDTAQAVTPGQGQTVQVAGVEIGDIGSVKLKDGRALVGLDIKPEYETLIRRDARAALRPRTGLKDMYVQVFPGKDRTPVKEGFTIPIANSLTDVDLDEILSALDARTRDYLTLLANGAGEGLRGKGDDLARVLKRYGPTVRDLGRVNREVAKERIALRRLVTSLAQINGELAKRPQDLSRLVSGAGTHAARVRQRGRQPARRRRRARADAADGDGHARTPSRRSPTSSARRRRRCCPPCASSRTSTPRSARSPARPRRSCARRSGPSSARPCRSSRISRRPRAGWRARSPSSTATRRCSTTSRTCSATTRTAARPRTRRAATRATSSISAGSTHQTANLQSVDDANGPMRPIFLTGTCSTLTSLVNDLPQAEFALGLSPLLATVCKNPTTRSLSVKRALRANGG